MPLGALIDEALPKLASKLTAPAAKVKESVIEFFQARLHHMLVQEGYSADLVEAALSAGIDDLTDALARTKALAAFKARPDFESLATAFKRVANIIKEPEPTPVDPKLLENPAEQALFAALRDTEGMAVDALARADYKAVLESMSQLRSFVDTFFDSVLVMDKDEAVRRNRLALLTRINGMFSRIADFRKIQTG